MLLLLHSGNQSSVPRQAVISLHFSLSGFTRLVMHSCVLSSCRKFLFSLRCLGLDVASRKVVVFGPVRIGWWLGRVSGCHGDGQKEGGCTFHKKVHTDCLVRPSATVSPIGLMESCTCCRCHCRCRRAGTPPPPHPLLGPPLPLADPPCLA